MTIFKEQDELSQWDDLPFNVEIVKEKKSDKENSQTGDIKQTLHKKK